MIKLEEEHPTKACHKEPAERCRRRGREISNNIAAKTSPSPAISHWSTPTCQITKLSFTPHCTHITEEDTTEGTLR